MKSLTRPAQRALLRLAAGLLAGLASATMTADPSIAQSECRETAGPASPIDTWLAAPGRHVLAGTIVERGRPLAAADGPCNRSPLAQLRHTVTAHLADGGVVLLGEVHDNGAQHALRAFLIDAVARDLAQRGRPAPALVFEHLRPDQSEALAAPIAPAATPEDARQRARDLMERLAWDKSGWPAASLFLPIFEAAVTNKLPILSGHPTQAEVRDLARRGLQALPAETVARLRLDAPLPDPLSNALLDELEASHCGLMPRAAFTNMALAQRYRDAHLAAALAAAASTHGSAILFAGNGHVRSDRAVPWDLAQLAAGRKALVVALMEVEEGKTDPAAYVPRDPSGNLAADYVVVTPRAERADPCEAMRARFKKK